MKGKEDKYTDVRMDVPIAYQDVFSHFYSAKNDSGSAITRTFLPSYQTLLIFNFGAPTVLRSEENSEIQVNKCMILGLVKQAFTYSLPPNSEILVVNFKNDAFYRFFGKALVAENQALNPDDLVPENCFTSLWTSLHQLKDATGRMDYILEFCQPYLNQRNPLAVELTVPYPHPWNPIKSVARDQHQTERNIQLNHKKLFGYSAKEFLRYQRFLQAIELLQGTCQTAKTNWSEIIYECGYYDQSQLIRDFKHFLNLSPTRYLKFQQDICIAKP